MKFKYIDTMKNWKREQYHLGRKKKASVKLFQGKNNLFYFFAERKQDGFVFNSLWGSHPNVEYQRMLDALPDMKFDTLEMALKFTEKWMDENVPELTIPLK